MRVDILQLNTKQFLLKKNKFFKPSVIMFNYFDDDYNSKTYTAHNSTSK